MIAQKILGVNYNYQNFPYSGS